MSRRATPRWERDGAEFDRAIGFVDATFALALTLLVTTLEVDGASAWTSLDALGDAVGPQFFAFVVAFVVIAGYWLRHHRLIASFAAIDTTVIVANLALVAAIVLMPFSTRAVGDPGVEDLPLPTTVMAVNVAAASILHAAVFALAGRRGLLGSTPDRVDPPDYLIANLAPAAVFLASIPVAYAASPLAAQLCWLALIPVGYLIGRRIATRARQGP
jgi:uncharacterized membrane protein